MDNTPAAIIRRLFKPDNNRKIIQAAPGESADQPEQLVRLEKLAQAGGIHARHRNRRAQAGDENDSQREDDPLL